MIRPAQVLLGFIFLMQSACQTSGGGVYLREQNLSLNEIRAAMTKVVGDFRRVSENQRDFYSQYFSPSNDPKFDAEKSKERAYAKFVIYGDRRPYDIEAQVYIEQKEKSKFEMVETDPKAAEMLLKEIKTNLNKSLEKRNIIDDFRAF
jgi:hypothetical protein